jgi:pyocin large subunit-like protein
LLGRFLSADTLVPDSKNPQQFNRYAYGLNNPVKYTDPSGHWADEDKKVHASSCTPWPVCIFNGRQLATQPDPWSPAVDTLQDEAEYKQLSKSAEQLFRENLESP